VDNERGRKWSAKKVRNSPKKGNDITFADVTEILLSIRARRRILR